MNTKQKKAHAKRVKRIQNKGRIAEIARKRVEREREKSMAAARARLQQDAAW